MQHEELEHESIESKPPNTPNELSPLDILSAQAALTKLSSGEKLSDDEAKKLGEMPTSMLQNENIWPIYSGFWIKLDSVMEPARTLWNSMPADMQKAVYNTFAPLQFFVSIGILDLKDVSDEEVNKMDKEKIKNAGWAVKIFALIDPEVKAIRPLLNAAIKAGNKQILVNEMLKTEIREARVRDDNEDVAKKAA